MIDVTFVWKRVFNSIVSLLERPLFILFGVEVSFGLVIFIGIFLCFMSYFVGKLYK